MARFLSVTSTLAPLPRTNVDTDQIIPAAYLKTTERSGLGQGLFAGWRYDEAGAPRADFELHRPEHQGARILLAGDNFGCGSSREHAVWALQEFGFEAVIAPRFADIFRQNALGNGLLPVTVPEPSWQRLLNRVEDDPATLVTVDLLAQEVEVWQSWRIRFAIDPFARHCLLEGTDALGYLLGQTPAIDAWESRHPPRVDTR